MLMLLQDECDKAASDIRALHAAVASPLGALRPHTHMI